MARRRRIPDEKYEEIEQQALDKVLAAIKIVNGTLLDGDDEPAIGVTGIYAMLNAKAMESGVKLSQSSLYRKANQIAKRSYALKVAGEPVTVPSSGWNDVTVRMPEETKKMRGAADWSAFARRPPRPGSKPRGRPRK